MSMAERLSLNIFILAVITALLVLAVKSKATSFDHNDVVYDRNGYPVLSLGSHTCVLTRWNAIHNPCEELQGFRISAPSIQSKEGDFIVYFNFDRWDLTPAARRTLDEASDTVQDGTDIQISGHADRIGTDEYNEALARRRALSVKNYLEQRNNINSNTAMTVRSYGERFPVTRNCDPNLSREEEIRCLSPDRRVELDVSYAD